MHITHRDMRRRVFVYGLDCTAFTIPCVCVTIPSCRSSSALCSIKRVKPHIQFPDVCCKTIPTLLLHGAPVLTLREFHLKRPENIRRHTPQFHHGQFLANTIVHPRAKWHESALIDHGLGLLARPALRQKGQRLGEVAWVALETVYGHPDDDVAGDVSPVGEGNAFRGSFTLHTGWDLIMLL